MYPFKAYALKIALGINLFCILTCIILFAFNTDVYYPITNHNNITTNHPIVLAAYISIGVIVYLFLYWQANNIAEWRFWIAFIFVFVMFTALPMWVLTNLLLELM